MARIARSLRFVKEVRTMTSSLFGSLNVLVWAVLFLALVIFVFSVVLCECVTDVIQGGVDDPPVLELWYGSLGRTSLTMFESVLCGVSWDEPLRPLLQYGGTWIGVAFCVYVLLCQFAIMNVVTALFVQQATRAAQEENDAHMAARIKGIFFGDSTPARMTREQFKAKLCRRDMQEYLKAIYVDASEVDILFDLLDEDESSEIDETEIVDGLFRLRGNATALEMSMLRREMRKRQEYLLDEVRRSIRMLGPQAASCDDGVPRNDARLYRRRSSGLVHSLTRHFS